MEQKLKKILLGVLKKILIISIPIIAIGIIIVGGIYILTINDGTWKDGQNSPKSYKNNISITGDGIQVNIDNVLNEALKNLGYSDEDIEQITTNLQNEGYSGVNLERLVLEKKLELLGLKRFMDIADINVMEIVWELNKELFSKYHLDKYEKLEYLVNAELVTKMPHVDKWSLANKLNGVIYFDRYMNGIEQPVRLEYVDEWIFNKLIESNDANVLNCFTMTEEGELKIAYYQEENGTVETNDDTVDVNSYESRVTNENPSFRNAGYDTKIIPYSTMIPEKYSLPFEYLWALLVMSEDYDFVKGMADLAYNSEIIISIYDNILENTTITEYTYDRHEKYYSQISKRTTETSKSVSADDIQNIEKQGFTFMGSRGQTIISSKTDNMSAGVVLEGEEEKKEYYIKRTIYSYINTIEIKVTYANVWIAEHSTEYNYYADGHKFGSGTPDSTATTTQGEDTETEKNNSRLNNQIIGQESGGRSRNTVEMSFLSNSTGTIARMPVNEITETTIKYMGDKWTTIFNSEVNIKEDIYSYTSRYVNNPDETKVIEKTNQLGILDEDGNKIGENFCSLLNASNHQTYITDNMSWLLEILENNEETADMIDLTKYLLNKATGKEQFILDNFSFDSIFNTTSIGTLYGGSVEEQLWFALLDAGYSKMSAAGVLGNIYAESGIRSDNLQNTYESSLGLSDIQYTEAVDNGTYTNFVKDQAGYGLAQWTSAGRKEGLYLFAQSKGVSISDPSMQIEYLLGEISQSGGANGYATFQMGTSKKGYSYASWKEAETIEDAAMAFCYVFERPKDADHSNRTTFASMYYERYKDATGPSTSIGDIELTGENKQKMQTLLEDAVRIANDNRYGYSQDLRNDEFYYDCSSLVARLYKKHFGISVPGTTASYERYTQYYVGNPKSIKLMPGDVLWRYNDNKGHVTIYIGNGNYVAAHSAKKPKPDQINVYQDNPGAYTRVYRFIR